MDFNHQSLLLLSICSDENVDTVNGLINFTKRRMVYDVINQVTSTQTVRQTTKKKTIHSILSSFIHSFIHLSCHLDFLLCFSRYATTWKRFLWSPSFSRGVAASLMRRNSMMFLWRSSHEDVIWKHCCKKKEKKKTWKSGQERFEHEIDVFCFFFIFLYLSTTYISNIDIFLYNEK